MNLYAILSTFTGCKKCSPTSRSSRRALRWSSLLWHPMRKTSRTNTFWNSTRRPQIYTDSFMLAMSTHPEALQRYIRSSSQVCMASVHELSAISRRCCPLASATPWKHLGSRFIAQGVKRYIFQSFEAWMLTELISGQVYLMFSWNISLTPFSSHQRSTCTSLRSSGSALAGSEAANCSIHPRDR